MNRRFPGFLKFAVMAAAVMAIVGAGPIYAPRLLQRLTPQPSSASADEAAGGLAQLASGEKDAILLGSDAADRLGIRTVAVESSTMPRTLELSGTLALDSDRLAHVHARFPGEIVELGSAGEQAGAIGFGHRVQKGQLLAVIWSRDLGEKKSDLIDALSQLRVDEDSLQRISRALSDGAIPDRLLQDAQRKVESDRIAVGRAVRTLQSWRIAQEEIDAVRAEAVRLAGGKAQQREQLVQQWARLEVRSPLAGVVIERNVTLGELVDTSTDLFKIADLSRLRVLAHAYEEDLPSLDSVRDDQRNWSVTVGCGPDAACPTGKFDQVGSIIDPNQHTAMVMGWVDNPAGRLRVGQFVTIRLDIPPPKTEVVIPAVALSEEGSEAAVFVQTDGSTRYVRRQVAVARRVGDKVFIRAQVTPQEKARGIEPLAAGQRVVVSRVVQLSASLTSLKGASVVQ